MRTLDETYAKVAIEALPDTPQWTAARRGSLGASMMADVLAVAKRDGKPLAARSNLLRNLVAERMTDTAAEHYVTPAMQWGRDHEAEAVARYEEVTGNLALKAGWIKHPRIEYFGATPDRIVGVDGLLECKCPTTGTFIEWLKAGVIPEEHVPQMTAQLAVTGRHWCDFVAFDPRIKNGPQIFVRRFEPEPHDIALIEDAAEKFLKEVEAMFVAVTQS